MSYYDWLKTRYVNALDASLKELQKDLAEHREECKAKSAETCPYEQKVEKAIEKKAEEIAREDTNLPSDGQKKPLISPEEDAAYMDAVKRGDIDMCAKMVREAAAKAMPDTKVVGEDGLPLIVYRGEATKQNKFFFGYREDNGQLQRNWFSSNEEVANMFGNTQGSGYFIDIRNPAEYDAKGRRYDNLDYKGENVSNGVVDALYSDNPNSDGVVLRNIIETDEHNVVGDDWLVNDTLEDAPNRIKSADPITYDDGNPIPLSHRFDFTNPDIRY